MLQRSPGRVERSTYTVFDEHGWREVRMAGPVAGDSIDAVFLPSSVFQSAQQVSKLSRGHMSARRGP